MQTDRTAFDQLRLKRLDAQTVQCRRTVQEDRVIINDLVPRRPRRADLAVDQLLRCFRLPGDALVHNFIDNKRLIQLNCHFTRNSALIHLQVRSDRDNGTTGEVDTLT